MDGAWLARARWRRRGAWLWPSFAALTVADAVIGHELPPTGDSQALVGAALVGCALNLIGVVVLSWPVGGVIRRVRPDLPMIVARDYGGTAVVVAVSVALLTVGLTHRSSILADRQAMREAVVRAEAWIGDRAPEPFRRNVTAMSVLAVQPGRIYRACVPGDRARTFCVVVDDQMPFAASVRPAGYEPNSALAAGSG